MSTTFIDALEERSHEGWSIFVGPPASHFMLLGGRYDYVTFCNGVVQQEGDTFKNFVGADVQNVEEKLRDYTVESLLAYAKNVGASAIVLRRGTEHGKFEKVPAAFSNGRYIPECVTYRVRAAFVI